jgi:hypothetical protein
MTDVTRNMTMRGKTPSSLGPIESNEPGWLVSDHDSRPTNAVGMSNRSASVRGS